MSTPSNILKGKRTKRQRPQSPLPFSVAHANFSSKYAGGDYVTSSTTSDEDSAGPGTTEEEEDMAKCLLLLAQVDPKNDSHFGLVPYKFTSKKYLETSISTNGKTCIYVYQCKTCNRTFPSFQALGGDRASHRKPKNVNAALENKSRLIISTKISHHHSREVLIRTGLRRSHKAPLWRHHCQPQQCHKYNYSVRE
uniref:C2H2-type domain-containing protein n=1 Tax=Daucus carota subsp. sativus TaxID=79200 RepID=A0A175YES5_DAUCS|nr:PREDICTED: zinc finger protein ZAT5-like [Daucus carota subsp. sativus]